MLALQMAIVGVGGAAVPVVGLAIYPPHVRASGFNLGHNIVMGLLGGLSPMTITAIQLSPAIAGSGGAAVWSIGIWLAAGAAGTVLGAIGLILVCPQADYTEEVLRLRGVGGSKDVIITATTTSREDAGGVENTSMLRPAVK